MPQPLAVTSFMSSPGRFELPAPRLGGVCSIQLSYGDIFDFSWSRMERSASQDFDDLIIRRRSLYPAELQAHILLRRVRRSAHTVERPVIVTQNSLSVNFPSAPGAYFYQPKPTRAGLFSSFQPILQKKLRFLIY